LKAARPFCAICATAITGTPRREPLGKDGAMVNVCPSCADEAPIATFGPERGYEGAGGHLSNDEITGAMVRVMGQEAYDRDMRFAQKIDISSTYVLRDGVSVARSEAQLAKIAAKRRELSDLGSVFRESKRLGRSGALHSNDRWRELSAKKSGRVTSRRIHNRHILFCELINRRVGWRTYKTRCSCGWRSKACNSKAKAYKLGKEHAPDGVFK
jgi:hypothetical protein